MSFTADDIDGGYLELQQQFEQMLFLARDKGLQKEAISQIEGFLKRVERGRLAAIVASREAEANSYLGLSMALRAVIRELEVYILLKEDQPEAAWNKLIDAQDMIKAAGRATKALTNLQGKYDRLRELETAFFPPQSFVSAGLIVHEQHCSICQDDYEKCDHIEGRAYMGRFCSLILQKVTADHIAFVDDPFDRRCRVTTMSVKGGRRNKMTGIATPAAESKDFEDEA